MEHIYLTLRGFVDPVFIVFVLMVISLIVYWKTSKKKTGVLILLLAIILFYAASILPVANYFCHYLEKDYINRSTAANSNIDVIVVLGGGSYDINYINKTYPSLFTVARLTYAAEYYHHRPVKYFVCSGKGPGKVSEAEMMARMAVSLGIPKEKIKIDAQSNNTWQNAAEVNKIFGNKDICIGLVTSAYHMKRSEKEFKKYFKNVLPLPANYLYYSFRETPVLEYVPQYDSVYKTALAVKEIVAQIWYSIK